MYEPAIQQAIEDAFQRYGLHAKHANMQMIRRLMHFEDLANHAHPAVRQAGQKLLSDASRVIPKPVAPMTPKPLGGLAGGALH